MNHWALKVAFGPLLHFHCLTVAVRIDRPVTRRPILSGKPSLRWAKLDWAIAPHPHSSVTYLLLMLSLFCDPLDRLPLFFRMKLRHCKPVYICLSTEGNSQNAVNNWSFSEEWSHLQGIAEAGFVSECPHKRSPRDPDPATTLEATGRVQLLATRHSHLPWTVTRRSRIALK